MKHSRICASLLASALYACSAANNASDGGAPAPESDAGNASDAGSQDAGAKTDASAQDGGVDPGTDGSVPDATTGGAPLTKCTDAVLYSGNPYFNGDLSGWVAAGQEKLADPPLRNEHLALGGQTVYYDTNFEIWRTDGTKVVRITGDEAAPDAEFNPSGACADARFITIRGLAVLPNGNVVVNDVRGNGLVELKTPNGACTAAPYAGNSKLVLDSDINGDAQDPGDVDGPGASAKFYGMDLPTADAQGNIYIADKGNSKIRKVANDAAHTVSTLFHYASADQPNPLSMTAMNGKLYVAGATGAKEFMWEIDTQSGSQRVVYDGVGVYPEVGSTQLAVIVAMTNDGQSLIVGSNKGYIWKLGTDGKVVTTLAGMGPFADYPTGIDLTKPIPVAQLPLKSVGINDGSLVHYGSDLLWAGSNGVGFHVFDIRCQ